MFTMLGVAVVLAAVFAVTAMFVGATTDEY